MEEFLRSVLLGLLGKDLVSMFRMIGQTLFLSSFETRPCGVMQQVLTGRSWIDVRNDDVVPLSNRKIDVFDDFWVENRVGTSFEPQNRCFR